ncbi:MAG: hypothetical protein U1D55_03115 [Phycisphaerae bacterium]
MLVRTAPRGAIAPHSPSFCPRIALISVGLLSALLIAGCPGSEKIGDAKTLPPILAAPGASQGNELRGGNRPPVVDSQAVSFDEDTSAIVQLTGIDPDGDPIKYIVETLPANARVIDFEAAQQMYPADLPYMMIGDQLEIIPDPDWNGEFAFKLSGFDGIEVGQPAEIDATVAAVNDPPQFDQAPMLILLVDEDSAPDRPQNQYEISAADSDDPPDSLQFALAALPNFGEAELLPVPTPGHMLLTYRPFSGYVGVDFLTLAVRDGSAESLLTAQIIVSNISISGTITDYADQPYANVTLELRDPNGVVEQTQTSDHNGFYAFIVPPNWSGSIGPDADFSLLPAKLPYPRVISSINQQNLVACRNYYVATNGSTSGGGHFATPFGTLRSAAAAVRPGDSIVIRGGTYASGSNAAAYAVMALGTSQSGVAGYPIVIRPFAGESVVISGNAGTTRELFVLDRVSYVDIEDLEFTQASRTAIAILDTNSNGVSDAHHVNVRRCVAHHNNYDPNFIGGAFRTDGPASDVVFEECLAYKNSNGFELREYPTQTSSSCSVPPKAGNIQSTTVDLPESQWDSWPGWTGIAARHCAIRRCIAFENDVSAESSNGIQPRYAIECLIEDNICFRNADDNIDGVGATRCVYSGNIAFDANPSHTAAGDGNGIKIGVRGGLDNLAFRNISFENPRAGIDMADSERSMAYSNTTFNNGWFGIWFEAVRAHVGGMRVINNISRSRASATGDLGFNGPTRLIEAATNLVADNNAHNWARPLGNGSLVGVDPGFLNEALVIDTNFPPGLSPAEQAEFIRSQVRAKLSLAADSPAVDRGTKIQGLISDYLGQMVDMGAIESH